MAQAQPEGGLPPPQRMRKNIKASLVNLTLNMRYKMTKKIIKFVITRFVFFQAENAPKSVFGRGFAPDRQGSLRRSPRPTSRLERGIPPPHSPPRSTPSASRTRRLELGASVLRPPQHKILATPVELNDCRIANFLNIVTVKKKTENRPIIFDGVHFFGPPCTSPTVPLTAVGCGCAHRNTAQYKSPTPSLFMAKRRSTYSHRNMGKFWGDQRWGREKWHAGEQRRQYLKRVMIEEKLLWTAYRNSSTLFQETVTALVGIYYFPFSL